MRMTDLLWVRLISSVFPQPGDGAGSNLDYNHRHMYAACKK